MGIHINIVYSHVETAVATSHLISLSNNLPRQKLQREAGRIQRENCISHLLSFWDVNAIALLSDTPVEIAKRATSLASGEVRLREEINFGSCLDVLKKKR